MRLVSCGVLLIESYSDFVFLEMEDRQIMREDEKHGEEDEGFDIGEEDSEGSGDEPGDGLDLDELSYFDVDQLITGVEDEIRW